jgi:hypothetical protein
MAMYANEMTRKRTLQLRPAAFFSVVFVFLFFSTFVSSFERFSGAQLAPHLAQGGGSLELLGRLFVTIRNTTDGER